MRKTDQERFDTQTLEASIRPKARFTYYVSGTGEFPFDMLRYDCCWPATSDDALAMASRSYDNPERMRGLVSIRVRSFFPPTIARWSSFGWSVGTDDIATQAASARSLSGSGTG
jgi:hypothetical protein